MVHRDFVVHPNAQPLWDYSEGFTPVRELCRKDARVQKEPLGTAWSRRVPGRGGNALRDQQPVEETDLTPQHSEQLQETSLWGRGAGNDRAKHMSSIKLDPVLGQGEIPVSSKPEPWICLPRGHPISSPPPIVSMVKLFLSSPTPSPYWAEEAALPFVQGANVRHIPSPWHMAHESFTKLGN